MKRFIARYGGYLIVLVTALVIYTGFSVLNAPSQDVVVLEHQTEVSSSILQTVVLAGGCFWCVEHDLEEALGVVSVVSGYMKDGSLEINAIAPTYEDYAKRGYREVVEVTYNKEQTSFERLAFEMIYHSDPTDGDGSFYDRGQEYAPAIYYANQMEKDIALNLISRINKATIYDKSLAVKVVPKTIFYKAEEYHQDYSKKNSLKYGYYRNGSGRDAFIKKYQTKLELFRVQLGMAG